MKFFILILSSLLSISAFSEESGASIIKRLDILEFQPDQRVYVEGQNSKGTITKILGNCYMGYTPVYEVQLDNGKIQSFCGPNQLGPVPSKWNYSFNYKIPLEVGKNLTIIDHYWNPGKIAASLKIEEILIGKRMSNADPERKIIISGKKPNGEKSTIILNDFSYSQFQFKLE